MNIHLAIWDSDEGTSVEHYWTEADRDVAVKARVIGMWDSARDGTPPEDWREIWPTIIERGCEDWVVVEEINLAKPDSAGKLGHSACDETGAVA